MKQLTAKALGKGRYKETRYTAEPKGPGRRVETAEAASVPLTFWAVLSNMVLLAEPEAETLAHATLTLFRSQF